MDSREVSYLALVEKLDAVINEYVINEENVELAPDVILNSISALIAKFIKV